MKTHSFLFLLATLISTTAHAAVLSRTVGAVEDEVFTSRQVLLAAVIDRLAAGQEPASAPETVADVNGKETTALLLEAAVAREAENFAVEGSSNAERDALANKARQFFASASPWHRLEFSEDEIKKMATRKLAAKTLIRLRSETLKGSISDAEALAYFEKNRAKFGQLPFTSFKENIKKFLGDEQLTERLRSWFDIVRRKHRTREFKEDEVIPIATPTVPAPAKTPGKE